VVTGEENEDTVFSMRVKLFSSNAQVDKGAWKERGVGLFKINVEKLEDQENSGPRKARLVMRMEGAKRLVLNVALLDYVKVDRPGDKQVRFSALEKSDSLTSFLLRVGRKDEAEDLFNALVKWKSSEARTGKSSSSSSSSTTTSQNGDTAEHSTAAKEEVDPNIASVQ